LIYRLSWTDDSGKPLAYAIRAALHAASLLEARGTQADDAFASYWNHAIGASFSPSDLQMGEQLLIDCGLVQEENNRLYPSTALTDLLGGTAEDAVVLLSTLALQRVYTSSESNAAINLESLSSQLAQLIPDAARREQALLALSKRFDDQYCKLIGEIGEEIVLDYMRGELIALGYTELARSTRRLSILSDQLGYDISAPRVAGPPRLIEVKSTTARISTSINIHISRNEANTAVKFPDWFLVLCRVLDVEKRQGEIIGFCNAGGIADLLPSDGPTGHWESGAVELPLIRLTPGVPRPS